MTFKNDVVADALRSSREDYRLAIEVAEKELRDATTRLDDLKAKLAACDLLLPDMEGKTRPRVGGQGMHAHIRPTQIVGLKSQRDAWREIALLSGGKVRPTDGAQLLVDARVAGVDDYEKARSNALSWMYNSHEWENVEEGIYGYLGKDGTGLPEQLAKGEEECPEEPCPTDGGDESPHLSRVKPVTPDALGRITV